MEAPLRSIGIGLLSAGFPPAYVGGAELQAAGLAERLAKNHRVMVFTRCGAERNVLEHWAGSGVELRPRASRPPLLRPAVDIVSGLSQLRRFRTRIDVLLAYQLYLDGVLGALAKKRFGYRLVTWIRGEEEVRPDLSRRAMLLSRWVIRASDLVLVQSPRMLDLTRRFLGNDSSDLHARLRVIGNGVDLLPTQAPERRAGILFVGRLVRRKGVALLLDALERTPGAKLTIVGDGPERQTLEKRVRRSDLPVVFTGCRSPEEVRTHMRRSLMLVLPSLYGEGIPNVVLEAMASGLPVIASDGAGIRDVIETGESGVLVPPGDVQQLSTAIKTLQNDGTMRERLAAGGRRVAEGHGWDSVVRQIESVFEAAMAAREGCSGK